MTTNEIPLAGCSPTPLASYLKALGVLRLIASPTSSVSGTAADPEVRGWWESECFYLRTSLDAEALTRFFLEQYAPSPIIAPWNGGSGFYPGDNKEGIEPIAGSEVASRFLTIADAIKVAFQEIQRQGLKKRPEGKDKARFVAGLRGCLADGALNWLDATLALSGDRLNFPQLLGTGGNDGRLDFTNNFMQRLASTLFDIATGKPKENAARLLRTALFADGTWGFHKVAIGQFAPGAAGGPNASTGYEADSNVNPWDFVLALEGAIMFAGAATRRHQGSPELGASFPFTVRPTGAGWGGVSDSDERHARAEFWAPLWGQPAGQRELEAFLKEGRAVLNGKTARDGLDFARAAASLGTSRGVSAFARYGFVMRSGKAYLAAPLATLSVGASPSKAAELISDLDTGDWLRRVRRLAREGAPARAQTAVKHLEHALFAMSEEHVSPRSVQDALCALGDLVRWLRDSRGALEKISPPPSLSSEWVRMADDETPAYRVAAALASLGWSRRKNSQQDAPAEGESLRTDASEKKRIALAAHFAPLAAETIPERRRKWDAQNQTRVVWGAGGLEANLIAVLQRRLIDVTIGAPLEAAAPARLADIAAFLEGEGTFDDVRCARLLAGLVWAQPARLCFAEHPRPVVPFAYAALKPIFAPAASLKGLVPPECKLPIPPGLIARLRSGDVKGAVRRALARARASGIACPFASRGISQTITGCRLAAALLIPLDNYDLQTLMERAYPAEKENKDVD